MIVTDIEQASSLADVRLALRQLLTPKFGEREASTMARLILMNLKGWDITHLMANEYRAASDFIKGRSREILNQLLQDVPIQYALGETTFYGLKLKVGPGVLIPRPETEELVDIIVKENRGSDLRVLDLCTGSGAIAIALARNLPFSEVDAIDISSEAIAIAKENASLLKVKVNIRRGDVFKIKLPREKYNIIVSNPPYVDESEKGGMEPNVLNYEPHSALFVPDDNPLIFYREIAKIALDALLPGGKLYFEINPRHASQLKSLLENFGYREVEIMRDIHGKERFAKAVKNNDK